MYIKWVMICRLQYAGFRLDYTLVSQFGFEIDTSKSFDEKDNNCCQNVRQSILQIMTNLQSKTQFQ